jgi:hypothetical protein
MNRLRHSRWMPLLVLATYLVLVGVAAASPWMSDAAARQLTSWCSGGLSRAVAGAAGDDAHTLDCPLCLPLQAADPAPAAGIRHGVTALDAIAGVHLPVPDTARPALPPVRGPPLV